MCSKPRIVVFSIIPRLGEMVKQLLPLENIKIVQFQAAVSAKDGYVVSEDEVLQLQDAEVLLSDNDEFLQFADRLPSLRWFQGTWVGLEGLAAHFRDKATPPYLMSRMSSGHLCLLMAEYVVGQVIVHERAWRLSDRAQASCEWSHAGNIFTYRTLQDLTVAVLGMGQIGQEIGRALKAFRCRVLGYSRTPHDQAALQHCVDTLYCGAVSLKEVVSSCDYIVSCLPYTPQTTGILNAAMLRNARPGSVLISIGRSNVVSEEDLITSLDDGPLAAAVLDVFDTEPLPSTSKLWTHPKVVITPHCAGVSSAQDVAAVFVDNYKRFTEGRPLAFPVDISRGY